MAATQQEEEGCFPYSQLQVVFFLICMPLAEVGVLSHLFVTSQTAPFPAGVDSSCREKYLTTAEFEAKFGMSKTDFSKLPKWKQTNKKKALSLF